MAKIFNHGASARHFPRVAPELEALPAEPAARFDPGETGQQFLKDSEYAAASFNQAVSGRLAARCRCWEGGDNTGRRSACVLARSVISSGRGRAPAAVPVVVALVVVPARHHHPRLPWRFWRGAADAATPCLLPPPPHPLPWDSSPDPACRDSKGVLRTEGCRPSS